MDATFNKPDHLDPATWAAVEQHRARFALAAESSDRAWAIGSAKELVESVARAVCDAKGIVVASGDDFDSTINTAHVALERQPGIDVSMTPEIRAIAGHAKKMILNLRAVRNEYGTGHGRAKVVEIDDEMISVVCDATVLWVRWALRRLEHLLIGEADLLLNELREAIVNKRSLQKHLEAVVLPDQPPETQRALGVAFAQRSAIHTFVSREVGVDPCSASEDLVAWPAVYRLGVVEGFMLSRWGTAHLDLQWVSTLVNVLLPVPPKVAIEGLGEIVEKLDRADQVDVDQQAATALVGLMQTEGNRLPPEVRAGWSELAERFKPVADAGR